VTKPIRKTLVESAYRLDLSEADNVAELARMCGGVFDNSGPTTAFATRIDGPQHVTLSAITGTDEALEAAARDACRWIPVEVHQRVAQSSPAVVTASELLGGTVMTRLRSEMRATEMAGLYCPHGRGIVCIGARQREPRRFSAQQSREWLPVATHIGAAWRLRNALSSEPLSGLVFSADGALVDEADAQESTPPSLREVLRRAVTRRERLRAGNGEGLWPAIVAGEWILVDKFEASGRRHVVAYACGTLARPFHVLTHAESLALRCALDGTASKVIASEMGVSHSTVSRLIQRALSALGLRDLVEASRLQSLAQSMLRLGSGPDSVCVGVLTDAHRETEGVLPQHIVGLTQAERDVLSAIVRGDSHRQVAARRGTAKRTIANQVASIFGKLGVRSRRELVARLVSGTLQGPPTARGQRAVPRAR